MTYWGLAICRRLDPALVELALLHTDILLLINLEPNNIIIMLHGYATEISVTNSNCNNYYTHKRTKTITFNIYNIILYYVVQGVSSLRSLPPLGGIILFKTHEQ